MHNCYLVSLNSLLVKGGSLTISNPFLNWSINSSTSRLTDTREYISNVYCNKGAQIMLLINDI